MSTVVGAVKSRLRSRSRHRYSSRSVSGENEAPTTAAPPLPTNSNNNGNLRQQALGESAMGARGSSLDHKNLPDVPNETEPSGKISPTRLAQSLDQPRETSASYNPSTVPDRFSSLPKSQRSGTADGNTQSQSHRRVASQPMSRPTTSDAMAQPPSPTSPRVQRKPMPPAKDGTNRRSLDTSIPSSQMEGMSLYTTPSGQRTSDEDTRGRVAGHRTARSTDLAPNDPSPLIPRFANHDHEKTTMRNARKYTPEQLPPNLRLPQDFRLGHSERTYVDTEWLPAVTRERIHHQKTEVIYPAVERDIHVHHYYQYSQVILVQEVLPARHFKLDKESGRKIEIPAPPGWEMPTKLTPRQPDTSELKQWTRHYLINDQHPNGVDEAPPTEENKQKYASRTGVPVA